MLYKMKSPAKKYKKISVILKSYIVQPLLNMFYFFFNIFFEFEISLYYDVAVFDAIVFSKFLGGSNEW